MPTPLSARRRARFAAIEKYLASDQPQKQFCLQEDISYSTFQYWLKKYRQANVEAKCDDPSPADFVPIRFGAPQQPVQEQHYTIEYRNGVVLHINRPIKPDLLVQLIRAQVN